MAWMSSCRSAENSISINEPQNGRGTIIVTQKKPNWLRMQFKNNKVWAVVGEDGRPKIQDGKVLIKYQLDQDHEYRVNPANLRPLKSSRRDVECGRKPPSRPDRTGPGGRSDRQPSCGRAVRIFTDGASSGNPGPSGIGAVLEYGDHSKEISKYIGRSTNNIAELEAIRAGLLELKVRDVPVRIYTDSSYAYGVLALNWKPKKNLDLIAAIRQLMGEFGDVKLIKVKGHAGHRQNERADNLARSAIKGSGRQGG
jgi:ribonuclease HI